MNRSDYIGPDEARRIALREAGIGGAAFELQILHEEAPQSLYQLEYFSEDMSYCCFVNAVTGEVIGFDCRPRAV
jgi:uncharacterized membrane protein YkoI